MKQYYFIQDCIGQMHSIFLHAEVDMDLLATWIRIKIPDPDLDICQKRALLCHCFVMTIVV